MTRTHHSQVNTIVRNGPYRIEHGGVDDKQGKITQQSALKLNAYFQKVDEWNEAAIRKRGETLFEKALELWPHPYGGLQG